MSILGKIMGGIFKKKDTAAPTTSAASSQSQAPTAQTPGTQTPGTPAPTVQASAPQPTPQAALQDVDVAGILDLMNDQRDQSLNWRTSIVDLMKLIGLDSSLSERKQLADELGYTGDTSDSAAMNIWLHKQVIQKIRDNGGQIPNDI